ncbi:hypothetical protein HPG69_007618 [Diceros bicornis minor]|uniref:SPATA31 domain-containing protein n=1 Tax=Diceros bicornis minor TaxID=77932 RepID=A0A7J7E9W4_DICBM|nr:hypothetical protein HPG69_007618 [Diceros bicornis minor]
MLWACEEISFYQKPSLPPLHGCLKCSVDHSPPQSLAFTLLPPHDTQTADPVVQPEATFPVDHPPPNPLPLPLYHHPVSENSSPDNPGWLSTCVPTIRGTDHSSLSVSECSSWKAHGKDLFPSTLAQCDFNKEFLAPYSSEASFGGNPATNLVEPGNLSFLSPDILALLERQVQKRSDFLMWEEEEKKRGSFPKDLRPDYQLNSSEKMLESIADKHDSAVSLPFWSSKGKPKEVHMHQWPPYPKTSEDHLQQKRVQLFRGLPSLHSKSLPSADHVSGDCSSIFIFNKILNASTGQEL